MATRASGASSPTAEFKEDLQAKFADRQATLLTTRSLGRETVDWNVLAAAGLPFFRAEERGIITEFENFIAGRGSVDDLINWLKENGGQLSALLCNLIEHGALSAAVQQQYVLSLTSRLIELAPYSALYFHSLRAVNPYKSLLAIVKNDALRGPPRQAGSDESIARDFIVHQAYTILASLFKRCNERDERFNSSLSEFCETIYNFLAKNVSVGQAQEVTRTVDNLNAIKTMAEDVATHDAILAERPDGSDSMAKLSEILFTGNQPQLIYLAGYCCWLFSYNAKLADLLQKHQIVPHMARLLVYAKPKCVRVFYYTFKNLLDKATFNSTMIACDVIKSTTTLMARNDEELRFPELVAAMNIVKDRLIVQQQHMNNMEMYMAELAAGKLRKGTPVHSEQFWREHCQKFELKNFAAVTRLLELLTLPIILDDKSTIETIEVACSDLGYFCQYFHSGKTYLSKTRVKKPNGEETSAKQFIIELMSSPYPDLAKQALMTVQKLLVTNWSFLSGGSASAGSPTAPRGGKQ